MFCKFVHSKKHLRCKNMFILYRITDSEFTELLITTELLQELTSTLHKQYINRNNEQIITNLIHVKRLFVIMDSVPKISEKLRPH